MRGGPDGRAGGGRVSPGGRPSGRGPRAGGRKPRWTARPSTKPTDMPEEEYLSAPGPEERREAGVSGGADTAVTDAQVETSLVTPPLAPSTKGGEAAGVSWSEV